MAFSINGPAQRLEMVVATSRILTLEYKIPRLLVNNPREVSEDDALAIYRAAW